MRACPSSLIFVLVVVVLGGMSMLSACGKKGPLYLPETPTAAPAEPAGPAPEPVEPPAADRSAQ